MNRQTKARVKHLLSDYENEMSAGMVVLARGTKCEIAQNGNPTLLAGAYSSALIDIVERYVDEGHEQEFLTKLITHVYSQVLQRRKEKADEANDQGQPGQ